MRNMFLFVNTANFKLLFFWDVFFFVIASVHRIIMAI